MIELTTGDEDGNDSGASDSEPSEDNLEEDEMVKIIPMKPKKKIVEDKVVKKPRGRPEVLKL